MFIDLNVAAIRHKYDFFTRAHLINCFQPNVYLPQLFPEPRNRPVWPSPEFQPSQKRLYIQSLQHLYLNSHAPFTNFPPSQHHSQAIPLSPVLQPLSDSPPRPQINSLFLHNSHTSPSPTPTRTKHHLIKTQSMISIRPTKLLSFFNPPGFSQSAPLSLPSVCNGYLLFPNFPAPHPPPPNQTRDFLHPHPSAPSPTSPIAQSGRFVLLNDHKK
jgi:hypothetical protein